MNNLVTEIIAAVAAVLAVSMALGAVARRCGQPRVIGQVLAGIMVGPSVLGRLPGHLVSHLFPPAVLPSLTALGQVAVVIFMFVVGYELDFRRVRGHRRGAPFVAAGGLLVPMGLGMAAVPAFRPEFTALGEVHTGRPVVLFMGVVMSVTALPVLAAIVRERGIAGSLAGVTATTAAGLMDVPAWILLAAVMAATAHEPGRPWPVTLLLVSAFAAIMLLVVRPVLRWWITHRRSALATALPVALVLALGSAWVTASLQLHPVFGGFLAGLTMPSADGSPDPTILRPMEEVGDLLLPLFFVVVGLSLDVGALTGTALVVLAGACVIASAGKMGPGYIASRVAGLASRDSAVIAVLVNTRGLTELIVLNAGLSAGLINRRLFTVLVLMALITTVATSPLLALANRLTATPSAAPQAVAEPAVGRE
jgi:Kef-type K+ transport system membrane component KefB